MWDIGGQESLRQAWSTYYTGTHFMILVVDSTDRERLTVAKEELYKMLGHEVSSYLKWSKVGPAKSLKKCHKGYKQLYMYILHVHVHVHVSSL